MELNAYYDRNGQLIKKPLLSEKGMRSVHLLNGLDSVWQEIYG